MELSVPWLLKSMPSLVTRLKMGNSAITRRISHLIKSYGQLGFTGEAHTRSVQTKMESTYSTSYFLTSAGMRWLNQLNLELISISSIFGNSRQLHLPRLKTWATLLTSVEGWLRSLSTSLDLSMTQKRKRGPISHFMIKYHYKGPIWLILRELWKILIG